MKPITKLLLGAVITVAALACYPAIAHADEDSYLAAVSAAWLLPTGDPTKMIAFGHEVCHDIDINGVAHAVGVGTNAATGTGVTAGDVGTLVYAAVRNLCPNNTDPLRIWIKDTLHSPGVGDAVGKGAPQQAKQNPYGHNTWT